jgi:hypothetical protein
MAYNIRYLGAKDRGGRLFDCIGMIDVSEGL